MPAARILTLLLFAISLAACAANSGPKEAGGTIGGAAAGGLIGYAIGGSAGNRLAGSVIGAAVGGLIGNRIGAALDDEDKRRAYAAQMQALETGPSGAPVAWRNPDSGRYGNVVPGPGLPGKWRRLPAIHRHNLYRWYAADRAWHRVPQSRRYLDRDKLRQSGFIALNIRGFA